MMHHSFIQLFVFITISLFSPIFAQPGHVGYLGSSVLSSTSSSNPNVTIPLGVISGVRYDTPPTIRYMGIPYALPPVGTLRYKAPVDWTSSYGPNGLNGSAFGPGCIGAMAPGTFGCMAESEDCLTLNIVTPLRPQRTPLLPVVVWFHGGGWVQGCSSQYDGRTLVSEHNIIFVSLNYRLQSFGWMSFQEAINNGESTGNYGFLDQQSALRWIKKYISYFGGDKNKVTIMGQSAGAVSVMIHTLNKNSKPLFQHGIAESGAPFFLPLAFALNYTKTIAARLNCTNHLQLRNCLRNKTVNEIITAQDPTSPPDVWLSAPGWFPVIDGIAIPNNPTKKISRGQFECSSVSIISGVTTDEGSGFVVNSPPITRDGFTTFVRNTVINKGWGFNESIIPSILQHYPPTDSVEDNQKLAARFYNDFFFTCGTQFYLDGLTRRQGGTPSYFYHYDYPACQQAFPFLGWGVYHVAEIPYVFNEPQWLGCAPFDSTGQQFAQNLGNYWTNLAKSGTPNQPQTIPINWKAYDRSTHRGLYLNATIRMENQYRQQYCKFWDSIYLTVNQ